MARVVIIGAGLTGISAAYHLEKQSFFDYALFEKESTPGGLCRSITQDGFTFDYTGHLLHANDPYFYQLIQQVMKHNPMNNIERRSYVYSQNKYTSYPYQMNLHGLPHKTIVECITGFINRPHIESPATFRDWVLTNFGTGFGKYFFFPFQQKLFAHKINHLTAQWTQRFVPTTSIEKMLYGALAHNKALKTIGYNAHFLYPKTGGIMTWVSQLEKQIIHPVRTNCAVSSIDMNKKTVSFANGHTEPYEKLISTMPLDHLLGMLIEKPSTHLKSAQKHLLCSSVINFNIGSNHPNISNKHWVYVPEKQYPFYRIGFWHNFSDQMVPPGCSSLYGEFAYRNRSRRWINHTIKESLSMVKKLYNLCPADIVMEKLISIPHAYVTYTQWREQNLPHLLQRLEEHDIHSIGRYGAWKYASMQEAVLDGKQEAETIIKQIEKTPFVVAIPPSQRETVKHE